MIEPARGRASTSISRVRFLLDGVVVAVVVEASESRRHARLIKNDLLKRAREVAGRATQGLRGPRARCPQSGLRSARGMDDAEPGPVQLHPQPGRGFADAAELAPRGLAAEHTVGGSYGKVFGGGEKRLQRSFPGWAGLFTATASPGDGAAHRKGEDR